MFSRCITVVGRDARRVLQRKVISVEKLSIIDAYRFKARELIGHIWKKSVTENILLDIGICAVKQLARLLVDWLLFSPLAFKPEIRVVGTKNYRHFARLLYFLPLEWRQILGIFQFREYF